MADQWRAVSRYLEKNGDLFFELVRIYLGLGLFAKGVYFAGHIGSALKLLEQGQLQTATVLLAHYVALAHLVGGLLVAAGLLTRWAAGVQVPILVGAVFAVHFREGLFASQNLEFALLVLFLLVLTTVHGGGRLSADWALERRRVLLERSA